MPAGLLKLMKHFVIGTAGHIDHGKTSLVKALTGVDTDRLKEEKERGITIELGFSHLNINGVRAGIVDVPGHERFVKNMLAGVGGIDFVILVIAADEGVMPQTREHLAICQLLGVKTGLIALTKTDLVDSEWTELVKDDLIDFVKGTFLEKMPVIPVSSQTGEGLEALLKGIASLAEIEEPKSKTGIFRIPIDRVFVMRGFGTVITGTLFSGQIQMGDWVEVYPREIQARVRGLQVHGEAVENAEAGLRTAVNLQGIEHAEITRGDVLGHPGDIKPSYMLDVFLEHLGDAPRPLKTRDRVRFHAGTTEVMGRLYMISQEALEPGESTYAQLRLESPVATLPRDRFVIRSYSPIVTIGGGEILDVMPRKHRRMRASALSHFQNLYTQDEAGRLQIFLGDAGTMGSTVQELTGRLTLTPEEIRKQLQALAEDGSVRIVEKETGLSLSTENFEIVQKSILAFLRDYHKSNPLRPGAAKEEVRGKTKAGRERIFAMALAELISSGQVAEQGANLRLSTHEVRVDAELAKVKGALEETFRIAGFQPPSPEDAIAKNKAKATSGLQILQVLIDECKLIRLKDNIVYHREALEEAQNRLVACLTEKKEITAAEFRDLLGITRKHAIPLLEYFDTVRVTLRVGDKRVLRSPGEGN